MSQQLQSAICEITVMLTLKLLSDKSNLELRFCFLVVLSTIGRHTVITMTSQRYFVYQLQVTQKSELPNF